MLDRILWLCLEEYGWMFLIGSVWCPISFLTRLPSKQELRWLRTRKPLAYRESTCTWCTNLSVSCPYEIIVYSVLKHINTARMHTISWQFIPLIYRSLGKWIGAYFLKSNLVCPFTSVKSCPLVILPVLILKNILGSIFSWPFKILKTYIWSPLNLRVSSVVRPHSFNLSS